MNNSWKFLEDKGLVYRFPSKSEEGAYRIVTVYKLKSGELRLNCNCVAGSFGQNCSHKKEVAKLKEVELPEKIRIPKVKGDIEYGEVEEPAF